MEWTDLDAKISMLNGEVRPFLWVTNWDRVSALTIEIIEGFKSVRYPTKEERQRAWEKFDSIRADGKERRQNERIAFRERSGRHKVSILHTATTAGAVRGHSKLDAEEMKRLGQRLSDARKSLSSHKGEMTGPDKSECFEAIGSQRSAHEAWWEEYRRQAQERHDQFRAKVIANIEKLQDRHRRVSDILIRAEAHADTLRSQIASARSADFAARASGWLAEEEARCSDLRRSLAEIESWIAEAEAKLR